MSRMHIMTEKIARLLQFLIHLLHEASWPSFVCIWYEPSDYGYLIENTIAQRTRGSPKKVCIFYSSCCLNLLAGDGLMESLEITEMFSVQYGAFQGCKSTLEEAGCFRRTRQTDHIDKISEFDFVSGEYAAHLFIAYFIYLSFTY